LFQIGIETLLFYHPGVWWISKRIRTEREHCCDDEAIALCGNAVEYARALTLMEEWRTAPALAMAANTHPLAPRIARLLGITASGSGLRSAGLAAGVLCLTAALLAGNAPFGGTRAPWNTQGEEDQGPGTRTDDSTIRVTAAGAKAPKVAKPNAFGRLAPRAPTSPSGEQTTVPPAPSATPTPAASPLSAPRLMPMPAPSARAVALQQSSAAPLP